MLRGCPRGGSPAKTIALGVRAFMKHVRSAGSAVPVIATWLLVGCTVAFASGCLGDVVQRTRTCADLPRRTILDGKATAIHQLRSSVREVGKGSFLYVDTQRCPGHVELVIYHAAEEDQARLTALWRKSGLTEIPVRWRNV